MNPHLERALLLFQQDRYDLAEAELRQALVGSPEDPYGHALLALCLAQREQFKEATAAAQHAVELAPAFSFAHYALARVYLLRNREAEALPVAQEAVRLDPQDPDYFALVAEIHLHERRWPAALAAAETGLQFDAEHVACANLRAVALVKLGRKAEAGQAIDAALARNPDNSLTHANQGWTLLERGEPRPALEHFRESLRLDPDNEWARRGIVEALKARNVLYALMLRYFLAMSRLRDRAQWAILVGAYVGNLLLGQLARSHPTLAPWILPLRILYLVFALMTWVASPFFNLALRMNRFGRLALSAEETLASNWLAVCVVALLLSLAGCLVYGRDSLWLLVALVAGFLILPLTGIFRCAAGWPRVTMAIYTAVVAVVGLCDLLLFSLGRNYLDAAETLLGIFALATLGSGWVVNFLLFQKVRH